MDVREAVSARLGVDARSLAAFRVGVASVVLLDLLLRSRSLTAFYTDAGVLPRSVLFAQQPVFGPLSLHALSGAAWFQGLLFALTAMAAVALLVGYRSTLATLVTGLLVVSLHVRNPLVLNGGDLVLQMLFLWGLFLPLGERWSVDALRADSPRDRVVSVATAGVLCQVVVIYTTNAALKLRGDAWLSGDAIRSVFSLEMFVVGLGHVLTDFPALLVAFDRVWLAMLAGSAVLIVATGWLRALLAAAFASMHVGMAATMQLGVFPLVAVVALLPFLPGDVWDVLVPLTERRRAGGEGTDWLTRLGQQFPAVAGPALPERVREVGRAAVTVTLAALLVAQLAYSAASVGFLPVPDAGPLDGEEPAARWSMFAPEPLSTDRWLKAPAGTPDGDRVDAFHGGAFAWDKPPDVSASYPTARWRKYVTNVAGASDQSVSDGLATYLCERSPTGRSASVRNVSVYSVEQPTRLDGHEPVRRVELATANCSA